MLALGIDPGTAICGFGLVEMIGNRLRPVHYGAVFTDKDLLPELRLKKIYDGLTELIEEYRPDIMSVEQLFFNRNVTTAISVGQARGVVLLTAANHNLPVLEFTPIQVKQSVVGFGSADKKQVQFMVKHLLNLRETPKPDDVADALAMAICGLHTASTRRWTELVGSEVRVHTYTSVREDAILLFGFLQKQYYDLFVLLIGISGVGPKVALGILSAVKPDDFYMAVENRDMKALTKLPGIGKKTAERLLLELKDKISGGSDVIDAVFYPQSDVPQNAVGEGYSNSEIVPALKTVPGYEAMPCEDIIKQVLKVFAGRK